VVRNLFEILTTAPGEDPLRHAARATSPGGLGEESNCVISWNRIGLGCVGRWRGLGGFLVRPLGLWFLRLE